MVMQMIMVKFAHAKKTKQSKAKQSKKNHEIIKRKKSENGRKKKSEYAACKITCCAMTENAPNACKVFPCAYSLNSYEHSQSMCVFELLFVWMKRCAQKIYMEL